MSYDDAARALFQVPHGEFVAERKRLAAELKAAGDKLGASRISRLQRPPVTAWAVNQLYWHARDAVDALFELAARLRAGDLSATTAHREALAKLRARAAAILGDAGHSANEATLRRISLTLAAVAAAGTWMPDAPGQLSADRDPPGFEAVGVINAPAAPLPTKTEPVKYDFDAPISPMVVATAPPPPAPAAPKRNAIAELAAKRKAMAEEEKLRKAAEKRGEEYVPPDPKANAPAGSASSSAPVGTASASAPVGNASTSAPGSTSSSESSSSTIAPIAPRTRLASVPPVPNDDSSDDDESNNDDESSDEDAPIAPTRARTLSIVPPLPPDEEESADDDIDTPTASDESDHEESDDDESDDDESDDDESDDESDDVESDDESDEVNADRRVVAQATPHPTTPKLSALEQLRLRKKQQAEEAEEERRRKFIEDGGTKDRVIAKRIMEAQERNRESSDAKRERVESAVRAKVEAQRADAQRASTEAKRVRSDDDSDDDDRDEDDTDAPTLTLKPGGRTDAPKGPPQATDLVSALAAKLGAKLPDANAPKVGTTSSGPDAAKSSTGPERRKIEARAKLKAELETRLRAANSEVLAAEQRVEKLTAELSEADDALEAARAAVEDLRDKLDAID